jgi:2,4-didehydro-3-deoxy-L-rhamnonate hydrolase
VVSASTRPEQGAVLKLANLHNQAVVVTDTGTIDLGKASNGSLPSELVAAIAAIDDVRDFCRLTMPEPDCALTAERLIQDLTMLGPPVPNPGQIFAVGLNYADHGDETGLGEPDEPMIFTKFASSICGPRRCDPPSDRDLRLGSRIGDRHRPRRAQHRG